MSEEPTLYGLSSSYSSVFTAGPSIIKIMSHHIFDVIFYFVIFLRFFVKLTIINSSDAF